jgi:hypothetical protein
MGRAGSCARDSGVGEKIADQSFAPPSIHEAGRSAHLKEIILLLLKARDAGQNQGCGTTPNSQAIGAGI